MKMVLKLNVLLLLVAVAAIKVSADQADDVTVIKSEVPEAQKKDFSKAEWAQLQKDLKPKIDNPNAKKIQQPASAGKVNTVIRGQIVGGANAIIGQFPWMAAINIDNLTLCGGSLILRNFVLTAAHCTVNKTYFKVTLGTVDRTTLAAGAKVIITRQKFEHPNYNFTSKLNDIAILKLPVMVNLTSFIGLVKLPPASAATTTFANTLATASGYGRTSDTSTVSRFLNFAQLTIIPNANCSAYYGSFITSSHLCTRQANKSVCSGDSGSPLVYKDSTNSWVQLGVTGFASSNGGCLGGPAAFARVSSFLGWISNVTRL